jgi:hypothetical protein
MTNSTKVANTLSTIGTGVVDTGFALSICALYTPLFLIFLFMYSFNKFSGKLLIGITVIVLLYQSYLLRNILGLV